MFGTMAQVAKNGAKIPLFLEGKQRKKVFLISAEFYGLKLAISFSGINLLFLEIS